MKMNLLKIKNKVCSTKLERSDGFVILFAVVIASILLTIALSISNVAIKEIAFGTSAKETNNSFFSADTGTECALVNDKSASSKFPSTGPASQITCAGQTITPTYISGGLGGTYSFTLPILGANGKGCARVSVDKTTSATTTTIISKGYNLGGDATCASTSASLVEREVKTTYQNNNTGVPIPPTVLEYPCQNLAACSTKSGEAIVFLGGSSVGFSFTPNVDGNINALWANVPLIGSYSVSLYDATAPNTILATTTVSVINPNTWTQNSITSVPVVTGHSYVIAVYIPTSSKYNVSSSFSSSNYTVGNITINQARQNSSGNNYPSFGVFSMYGFTDVTFVPN